MKNRPRVRKVVGVIYLIIRNISISTLKVQTLPNYSFSRKTDFGNDHLGGPERVNLIIIPLSNKGMKPDHSGPLLC
jgi:hypothetical protein